MTTSPRDDGRDDIDARFADIVSHWDEPPVEARPDEDEVGRAPAPSEGDPSGGRPEAASDPTRREPIREPRDTSFEEPTPWRQHTPPDDPEDEHFVPSSPQPLPDLLSDWTFYLALVGLVGGPLWLVYLGVFAPTERSVMVMAGVLTLAGFVTLVMRSPRDRDDDSGDDGARV